MRKRLYQALPENSKLVDNVRSTVEEKTKKRLYADTIVNEHDTAPPYITAYNGLFAEVCASAAKQLDAFYAIYGCYEKECLKNTLAMYSLWRHSSSNAIKFFEIHMDIGKATWETSYATANALAIVPPTST